MSRSRTKEQTFAHHLLQLFDGLFDATRAPHPDPDREGSENGECDDGSGDDLDLLREILGNLPVTDREVRERS